LALSAIVLRDGVWLTIPARDLVPGDVIKLFLGGIVAADVRVTSGEVLLDQSMLTGESISIEAGVGFTTFAGALVQRGEAIAEVSATGTRTKFGHTAELVRSAHSVSSQQTAVLLVVRYLATFNGALIVIMILYALLIKMPMNGIVPMVLTAILASIPVALPATFTLAAALGARELARLNVLPTRLSAVDDAATMDVLCTDKTGTLTMNKLAVAEVHAFLGFDEPHVLAFATLACAEGGGDPVDAAIRAKAGAVAGLPVLVTFTPFDPATRMASAVVSSSNKTETIVKGAFAAVSGLVSDAADALTVERTLEARGFRVLAVAIGQPGAFKLVGLIALTDPPRPDAASLLKQLHQLGVRMVMVTGDAPVTAGIVAKEVGLQGEIFPQGEIPLNLKPEDYAIYAGILPEQKFKLVQEFQRSKHTVGMCGDGANDAPALRQAQIGIAVSTATDVAKSAAGMVLTQPGLGGVVAAIREGRVTFQRILAYTLNVITKKIATVLFMAVGLMMTGHAILTPMLMVIVMVTGDFLAMSLTTDNVAPSAKPNVWHIGHLTLAGIVLGVGFLAFLTSSIAVGVFFLHLSTGALQSLAFISLVFGGEGVLYVIRGHHRFLGPRPSVWLVTSSLADLAVASGLAATGIFMIRLPSEVVFSTLGGAIVFAALLDAISMPLFAKLAIS
jgi:H+-transporting ATPase